MYVVIFYLVSDYFYEWVERKKESNILKNYNDTNFRKIVLKFIGCCFNDDI